MGRRRGKVNRASRMGSAAAEASEPERYTKAPHSFVIKRGAIGHNLNSLMLDTRKLMEPFTASNLKVKRQNSLRDFVSVAGVLHVSHLVCFTRTEKHCYLRVARTPHGPTLTFRIAEYCLARDVLSSVRKAAMNKSLFFNSPLLVMNGFSSGSGAEDEVMEVKIMTTMFRNMFPSIDVNNVNLSGVKRTLLLDYDASSRLIRLRHYAVRMKPIGVSKPVKKLFGSKRVPDLGNFTTMDDVLGDDVHGFTSGESDGEVDERDESRHVTLPQNVGARGTAKNEKSAVRLTEIGPRMTLELIKVEEGLMEGEVLFHSFIKKTAAEVKERRKNREEKARLKEERKRIQSQNVARKQKMEAEKLAALRAKHERRQLRRQNAEHQADLSGANDEKGPGSNKASAADYESDD